MKNETIEEIAMSAVAKLKELQALTDKYNDFGSPMGICDDVSEIIETLERDLRRARRLCSRLKTRVLKWEAGERTVEVLADKNNL